MHGPTPSARDAARADALAAAAMQLARKKGRRLMGLGAMSLAAGGACWAAEVWPAVQWAAYFAPPLALIGLVLMVFGVVQFWTPAAMPPRGRGPAT